MKKYLALALAVLMLMGLMSGCSESPSSDQSPSPSGVESGTSPSSESAVSTDPSAPVDTITIRVLSPGVPRSAKFDAVQEKLMEEFAKVYGYKINFDYYTCDYAQEASTLDLMLGSNDIDCFTAGYNGSSYRVISTEGLIQPLNDLLAEHGPNITKYYDEYFPGGAPLGPVTVGGNIMGLTAPNQVFTWHAMFIRKDLLDEAGLPVPTNIDELETALYAIQAKRPEIIPITGEGAGNLFNSEFVGEFMPSNQIGADGNPIPYISGTGGFTFYPGSEYNTAFFERMSRWYKDGIINNQIFTWTATENIEAGLQKNVACMVLGPWNLNTFENKHDWVPLYDLKNSRGEPMSIGIGNNINCFFGIAASSQYAKEIVEYWNFLTTSVDHMSMAYWGFDDISYTTNDAGGRELMDIDIGASYQSDLSFRITCWPLELAKMNAVSSDDIWNAHFYFEQMSKGKYERANRVDGHVAYTYDTELNSKLTDLRDMVGQTLQSIIMGAMPVSELENLEKRLYDMSFQEYIDAKNTQYQNFIK